MLLREITEGVTTIFGKSGKKLFASIVVRVDHAKVVLLQSPQPVMLPRMLKRQTR